MEQSATCCSFCKFFYHPLFLSSVHHSIFFQVFHSSCDKHASDFGLCLSLIWTLVCYHWITSRMHRSAPRGNQRLTACMVSHSCFIYRSITLDSPVMIIVVNLAMGTCGVCGLADLKENQTKKGTRELNQNYVVQLVFHLICNIII